MARPKEVRFTLNDRPETRLRNTAYEEGLAGLPSRLAAVRAEHGDELASKYAHSYRRGAEARGQVEA